MKWGLDLSAFKDPRDYMYGSSSVPQVPYQEDGNWEAFLPKYEPQAEDYETHGCTVWGAQNQLEILYKRIYGKEMNFSERFTYLLSGVNPGYGGDPQRPYESIRNNGVVFQDDLPVPDSLEEFLTPKPMNKSLLAKGEYWKGRHDFRHEWVWYLPPATAEERIKILKEALQLSPLGVSVSAWHREGDIYVDNNRPNNHWCVLYKIDDQGMWVMDSYDHYKKCLGFDHEIARVKRIWINRKTKSALVRHRNILQVILDRLMQKETIVDVANRYIGKDASPQQLADSEVACAESVSYIYKQVYKDFPMILGTWTLRDHLTKPTSNFIELKEPVEGCIVLSATGTGKRGTVGHTGIYMGNDLIASNNSLGLNKGKFTVNYTLATWKERYVDKQGMEMRYFDHV